MLLLVLDCCYCCYQSVPNYAAEARCNHCWIHYSLFMVHSLSTILCSLKCIGHLLPLSSRPSGLIFLGTTDMSHCQGHKPSKRDRSWSLRHIQVSVCACACDDTPHFSVLPSAPGVSLSQTARCSNPQPSSSWPRSTALTRDVIYAEQESKHQQSSRNTEGAVMRR